MALPKAKLVKVVIDELSGVDAGAQAPAMVAIMKRAPGGAKLVSPTIAELAKSPMRKRMMLVTAIEGHTHLLDDGDGSASGYTTSDRVDGATDYSYHSHPWARAADGTIVIGESAGHTHELLSPDQLSAIVAADDADLDESDTPVKKAKETVMATPTDREKQLETELTKARQYGELNDEQRAHYRSLSESGQLSFLAKGAEDRMTDVTKAKDADPVIVEFDGVKYRKSAGEHVLALARTAKASAESLAKRDAELEMERLEKRAKADLPNLPKTPIVKAKLLKAVDTFAGFTDEERKEAHEMLVAADKGYAGFFKQVGHAGKGASIDGTAAANWENGLAAFAKAKNKSPVEATEEFLSTDEGDALYGALTDSKSE